MRISNIFGIGRGPVFSCRPMGRLINLAANQVRINSAHLVVYRKKLIAFPCSLLIIFHNLLSLISDRQPARQRLLLHKSDKLKEFRESGSLDWLIRNG